MSRPTTTVEFAFDLTATGGDYFTLDDATLGTLDTAPYGLGGDVYVDVTDYVRSVSIRRGRSSRLDRFEAGQATITLDNRDRRFDPNYAGSPYVGNIRPRKQARVTIADQVAFTGYVEDWNLEFSLDGDSTAIASCVDGFALLAARELTAQSPASTASGARVDAILSLPEVDWPATKRDIDAGLVTLAAGTVEAGTNALEYLQLIEQTEAGALFVARDGVMRFIEGDRSLPFAGLVFSDASASIFDYDEASIPYADASTDYLASASGTAVVVPYEVIELDYGTERLFNQVTVTRVGGTAQVASGTASQALYGISALSIDGTLHNSDADALALASYYLDQYEDPASRIGAVGVNMNDQEFPALLAALELGTRVRVRFTPNGIGEAIDQSVTVEGIEHEITPSDHRMTVRTDPTFDPEVGGIGGFLTP